MNIKQLVDKHQALAAETDAWFVENVKPRLDACKTIEEVITIKEELLYAACADGMDIRSLPSTIDMQFIWALDRVRQLQKMGKA